MLLTKQAYILQVLKKLLSFFAGGGGEGGCHILIPAQCGFFPLGKAA